MPSESGNGASGRCDLDDGRECGRRCRNGKEGRGGDRAVIAVVVHVRWRRGTFVVGPQRKTSLFDRRDGRVVREPSCRTHRAQRQGCAAIRIVPAHLLREAADAGHQRERQHRQKGESGHRALEGEASGHRRPVYRLARPCRFDAVRSRWRALKRRGNDGDSPPPPPRHHPFRACRTSYCRSRRSKSRCGSRLRLSCR